MIATELVHDRCVATVLRNSISAYSREYFFCNKVRRVFVFFARYGLS